MKKITYKPNADKMMENHFIFSRNYQLSNLHTSLQKVSDFCKQEQKENGCENCPLLRFCEIIADGEIVPLSTIIQNIMLAGVAEDIAKCNRDTPPKYISSPKTQ